MSTKESRFKSLLKELDIPSQPPEEKSPPRIENHAGYVRVPVGLAGPLQVGGPEFPKQAVYAPLATTEGALVASCSRGCKAFSLCGGVQIEVFDQGMSRSPCFTFPNPRNAIEFARYIPSIHDEIAKTAESTSRHLRLKKITPNVIGSRVDMHIDYHCGEAAGQNMVAIATQAVGEMLMASPSMSRFGLQGFVVELGGSSEKKPSALYVRVPRGVEVMAWGSISNDVCQRVLGCSTEEIHKNLVAGRDVNIRAGLYGYNVNTTNVMAAMFLATGQDVACIAEGCYSHIVPEYDSNTKELTMSIYYAGLPVGTVGGGTSYATQELWLKTLKCTGPGSKTRLAGMIAAFAMALDLSTAAAIISHAFTDSHKRLGRGPSRI